MIELKVIDIKRMNNSLSGNPNFKLTLEDETGKTFKATTMNDYMCNYRMGWYMEGQVYKFDLKFNKKSTKVLHFRHIDEQEG
jgi:hypothetical protein